VPADRFSHMVDDDESGAGSIAQPQQGLAQRSHGAGIVLILIVRGIERIEDDDFSGCGTRRGEEMIQLSMTAKNGAISTGTKGSAVRLRCGRQQAREGWH
jgi:hypothetical protein